MKIAKYYTFELEFVEPAILPEWKGNLIRGAIGKWLRNITCTRNIDCRECNYIFNCPYGYLFRSKSKGLVLRNIKGFTKPYVIKPPLEKRTEYRRGSRIKFSVVLFGDAIKFENAVLNAVFAMCNYGLGTKDAKGRLKVVEISAENPLRKRKEIVYDGDFYDSKLYIRQSDLRRKIGRLFKIDFLTPFRILRNNALISEPSFRDFAPYMLRKYSAIFYQYLKVDPNIDINKELERAEKVIVDSLNLKRRTFIYRNKAEEFVHGYIVFYGKLSPELRNVLRFCELCHVGKRATYGHGWYSIVS